MSSSTARLRLDVRGHVQGVGFRPFIWRLAHELGLTGHVANTSSGAIVEIQGPRQRLDLFKARLKSDLPPLASIAGLGEQTVAPIISEASFAILESEDSAEKVALITPDAAVCQDCLADIRDPENPRFGYAFTNCTNCGPRFSITSSLPYDRAKTAMSCFAMCDACAAEYGNPANRRFHAQPVACQRCGPKTWLVTAEDAKNGQTLASPASERDSIGRAARLLLAGKIVAIRGLGGFQLACDARNAGAVATLRERKRRPHKALAVMTAACEDAEAFCAISAASRKLLQSPASPITLCPKREVAAQPLACEIAPDVADIGVMLPATPLHALLLASLAQNGLTRPALVMTSANQAGEPICLGNRQALQRLSGIADAWLLHNRDILCRVDDSVVAEGTEGPVFFRRSRGYTPEPLPMPFSAPAILGLGAELKTTFCLTRASSAFLSQHIGDMKSPAALEFYRESLRHMERLLDVAPAAVVHDLHPDFITTRLAGEMARHYGIPAFGLQHHAAHALACLADNGHWQPALALCLDGSGLGEDGAIWGGELLLVDPLKPSWQRLGSLSPFPLPGGEKAIEEPWRIALGLEWLNKPGLAGESRHQEIVLEMLRRSLNTPMTTSCGRLFDAVSALTGFCKNITYEGQAAIRLERAALAWLDRQPMPAVATPSDWPDYPASARLFGMAQELMAKLPPNAIAAWFHDALSEGLAAMAAKAANKLGISHVALTGGVLQNRLLQRLLLQYLRQAGVAPLIHTHVPPGDGGLALGQAVWGMRLLAGKNGGQPM